METAHNRRSTEESAAGPRAGIAAVFETLLVFLVFAFYAGYPVPEPNEPHYLSKAKHAWDANWIADDFFLDSADSHWAFYLVCGWLPRLVSLSAAAWIGRIVTWALLAAGWRRLSYTVLPCPGAAVLSAALFVALSENFHQAGEWAVGGFEAKGIAYALVLFGLADLLRNRLNAAWILFGAAAAFHVLVGGWAMLAAGLCWIATPTDRPRLWTFLPGVSCGLLLSLIGVGPALELTIGVDPIVADEASYIYVYERLKHHLSFFDMQPMFRVRFALLITAWLALNRLNPVDSHWRQLWRFLAASLLFVFIGIVLSSIGLWQPHAAAQLLRFYWFRLADVLLPLGVALMLTAAAYRFGEARPHLRIAAPLMLGLAAAVLLTPQIRARFEPGPPRADKPGKVANFEAWRDVCHWIAENTPRDACFLTPRNAQTFKWYAERSEVVTWKDLPQDAENIVAWWLRHDDIHGGAEPPRRWHASLTELSASRLRELGSRYHAQFVLCEAEPPLDLPCVYRNQAYAVYRLELAPQSRPEE